MKMDSYDRKIQEKFGYGDEWSYSKLIDEKKDFKYIKIERPLNKNAQLNNEVKDNPIEYMWKNHSLIDMPNVENGKIVVAIAFNPALGSGSLDEEEKYNNPTGKFWKIDGRQIPNKVLEATRNRSIARVNKYLSNSYEAVKYFVQLDLVVDATKKASEIDLEKAQKFSMTMLEKAIGQADYIVIAWGSSGQAVINRLSAEAKKELREILASKVKAEKGIWFGTSKAPRHIISAPTNTECRMNISDLDKLFSKKG